MQLSGDLRFAGSSGRQGDQRLVYPLVSLKVAHHASQVFDRFVTFLDQVHESELLITLSFDEQRHWSSRRRSAAREP